MSEKMIKKNIFHLITFGLWLLLTPLALIVMLYSFMMLYAEPYLGWNWMSLLIVASMTYAPLLVTTLVIFVRRHGAKQKWSKGDVGILHVAQVVTLALASVGIWAITNAATKKAPTLFPLHDPDATYTIIIQGDYYTLRYTPTRQTALNTYQSCRWEGRQSICADEHYSEATAFLGRVPADIATYVGKKVTVTGDFVYGSPACAHTTTTCTPTKAIVLNLNSVVTSSHTLQDVSWDTTPLATYRNDKFGFTLEYPREWNLVAREHDIQADAREYQQKCASGEINGCGGMRWPDYQVRFYQDGVHAFDVNIHVIPLADLMNGKENAGFTFVVQRVNTNPDFTTGATFAISESTNQHLQDTLAFIPTTKPLGCLWLPDFVAVDVTRPGMDRSIYEKATAYYYDQVQKNCTMKDIYHGDGPNIPFASLADCQQQCM